MHLEQAEPNALRDDALARHQALAEARLVIRVPPQERNEVRDALWRPRGRERGPKACSHR